MKNYLNIKNFIFLILFVFLSLGLRWPLGQGYPTLFGYSPIDYTVNSIQTYRVNSITSDIELRLKQKKLEEIETDLTKLSKLPIDSNELDKLYVKYYTVIAVQCIDKRDLDCLLQSIVSLKRYNYTKQDQLFLDEYFFHKHSSYIKELFEQTQSEDSTYSKLSSCETLIKLSSFSSSLNYSNELPSLDKIAFTCKKVQSQHKTFESKSPIKHNSKKEDLVRTEPQTHQQSVEIHFQEKTPKDMKTHKTYESYTDYSNNYGNGSVLCRDGTISKSCVCGGSYRGCCSRHGGVAGCY